MEQSVLEYKETSGQKGLLVEFAEPEGKEGTDPLPQRIFQAGLDQGNAALQRSCIQRGILKKTP